MNTDPLWDFIQTHVTSFAKWDLMSYFAARPDAAETVHGLAARLARGEQELAEACSELAQGGILVQCRRGSKMLGPAYSLSPDEDVRRMVQRFAKSTLVRETRLSVLTHLLRSGAR